MTPVGLKAVGPEAPAGSGGTCRGLPEARPFRGRAPVRRGADCSAPPAAALELMM